jgi:DUF4097 and DUF4098 domain-containing protein YvlB
MSTAKLPNRFRSKEEQTGERGRQLKPLAKVLIILVAVLPSASPAQTRIYGEGGNWAREITGSLAAARNLRVKMDMGSVRITGGAQQEIDYTIRNLSYSGSEQTARREFENYKISASIRGDTAWIVGEWQGGRSHRFSGDVTIRVPREMNEVKVETDGGNLSTSGITGRLEAESGGGNIHVDDIGGTISAETGGGGIEVGNVASDVNLHTGGGPIKVNSAKGKIVAQSGGGSVQVVSGAAGAELETGGGTIEVERCNGNVKATTGGGNIDLGDIGGGAEISSGGGSLRLASAKGPVRAETGGGMIELGGIPSARAETGAGSIEAKFIPSTGQRTDSWLQTTAGDITVYIDPSVNLSIRASIEVANGHRIRSDFPEIHVTAEGGDWGPKTVTGEGNLNGGGPTLKVRTTTGDISIRRASR